MKKPKQQHAELNKAFESILSLIYTLSNFFKQ